MGTRADFYIGKGEEAEWLGSIAWDGYPDGLPIELLKCKTEKTWRKKVTEFLEKRDDGTFPKDGWPWPWENSQTTDYAYTFDKQGKQVMTSGFGRKWVDPLKVPKKYYEQKDSKVSFPDMSAVKNVTLGKRSGLIVMGMKDE